MSTLSSPTASTYSGTFFGSTAKNRPPANAYIKSHKSVSFSYAGDNTSFQQGILGDSDSYLVGTLHLNYGKQYQVKDITLNLKGTEKTTWYKAQARTKALYSGEQIVVDHSQEIWRSNEKEILNLDVPFKIKIPYNLPESITTDVGTVSYVLRAIIHRKGGLMSSSTQIVEVDCPLKRTIILDNSNLSLFKLRGESKSSVDYSFTLPANKNFNLGTYVTIPIRMRFLRPGVSVERIEVALKSCMDFRCSNPNETRHVKENVVSLVIARQEIRSQNMDGEYSHTINLFIPRSIQPTYSGRFISISHQFCVKFCLWGANEDFQVEESSHTPSPEQPSPQLIPQHLNRPPHQPTAMVIPSSDVHHPEDIILFILKKQQIAAIHHQQQLYNKKSPSSVPVHVPVPRLTPPNTHSRSTSNSSHLNVVNMNDSMLPPSPSISPSRLNVINNASKLPPYAAPEQVYARRSPNLTPQQIVNSENRKENKLEINTTLQPLETSPPSYKERLTPTPEE
ncbi:23826_t:CDS:2, partial [Racocetra persica]